MRRVLRIESSLNGDNGHSTRLVRELTAALVAAQPDTQVTVRDLVGAPLPHLDVATFHAFAVPADQRTAAQQALVATSDSLIAELRDNELIVIGLPMYNFGVPSTLKAWIDHVMRAGVTFGYGAGGPQGFITGKRVVLVCSRGGSYAGTALDHQLPYLTQVLGFMGMVDVEVVLAEGMAQTAKRDPSLAAASASIGELVNKLVAG